jgi:hypothetical protein
MPYQDPGDKLEVNITQQLANTIRQLPDGPQSPAPAQPPVSAQQASIRSAQQHMLQRDQQQPRAQQPAKISMTRRDETCKLHSPFCFACTHKSSSRAGQDASRRTAESAQREGLCIHLEPD